MGSPCQQFNEGKNLRLSSLSLLYSEWSTVLSTNSSNLSALSDLILSLRGLCGPIPFFRQTGLYIVIIGAQAGNSTSRSGSSSERTDSTSSTRLAR